MNDASKQRITPAAAFGIVVGIWVVLAVLIFGFARAGGKKTVPGKRPSKKAVAASPSPSPVASPDPEDAPIPPDDSPAALDESPTPVPVETGEPPSDAAQQRVLLVEDPVCKQPVDPVRAQFVIEYGSTSIYFDTLECLTRFRENPNAYAPAGTPAVRDPVPAPVGDSPQPLDDSPSPLP
ncbi:MAG: YHS domain-containing protein [Armatimonadetes bacterium]|nr:YHS domain-containing protein [Armatimonadota bacterium]